MSSSNLDYEIRRAGAGVGVLAGANTAYSTSHENTTDAADFDETVTINGNDLVAGDVVEVDAMVWVEDNNSTDTLTILLKFGTETIVTTAAVDVADNDLCHIHALITITTAGASGYIMAQGYTTFGVPGTAVPKPFRKALAAEDLSGDIEIAVNADWSVAHADNECELQSLIVKVWH